MSLIVFDMGQRIAPPEHSPRRRISRAQAASHTGALGEHAEFSLPDDQAHDLQTHTSQTEQPQERLPRSASQQSRGHNAGIEQYQYVEDALPKPMTLTAADLMTSGVVSLAVDATLLQAWQLFSQHRFRYLPLLSDQRIQALLSMRDLLDSAVSLTAAELEQTPVLPLASRPVYCVEPDTPLSGVIELMVEHGWGCLPVVHDEQLAGIICRSDLLRAVAGQIELDLTT